ncbi:hypothetical protein LG293_17155 (plasmid) [Citricoccus nitrophenolicus]
MKIPPINLLLILNPSLMGATVLIAASRDGALMGPMGSLVLAVTLAGFIMVIGTIRVRRERLHREKDTLPRQHSGLDPMVRDHLRTTAMLSGAFVASATSSIVASLVTLGAMTFGIWLLGRRTPSAAAA